MCGITGYWARRGDPAPWLADLALSDADGELAVPADESLGDLDEAEVSNGDEAREEADAEVGPMGDADLVDLELDD